MGGETPTASTPNARNAAFTADPAEALGSAKAAAGSNPQFGSVYQTGNAGRVAAVHSVDVTQQSDGSVNLVIRRTDGSQTELNTETHWVAGQDEPSPSGRTAESGLLLDSDSTTITAAAGFIDYDPDNLGDWLVAGYWLHAIGDWENGVLTGVEIGAFVDGPELVAHSDTPNTGTATYQGEAGGLYVYRAGSDEALPEGTHEVGDYEGTFRATADFGTGMMSGEISNIRIVGIAETPEGMIIPIDERPNVRLRLEPTSIVPESGQMARGTVRIISPDDPYLSQEGYWGGQLSNQDDGDGNPRALAGTHGGSGTSQTGAEVVYVGAHFGTTGDF